MMKSRIWNKMLAAGALACAVGGPLVATAAEAPSGSRAEDKPKPTIKSAMADVGDISVEVARIEKRLVSIDQSVAEINASLKHMESLDKSLAPVGELTRPEGLNSLIDRVSDTAFSRGVWLILIASACAAGLIILLAYMLRWTFSKQLK
jgi:hypothetical protein